MGRIKCGRVNFDLLQGPIERNLDILSEACMRLDAQQNLGPLKFPGFIETEQHVKLLLQELMTLINNENSLKR